MAEGAAKRAGTRRGLQGSQLRMLATDAADPHAGYSLSSCRMVLRGGVQTAGITSLGTPRHASCQNSIDSACVHLVVCLMTTPDFVHSCVQIKFVFGSAVTSHPRMV